MTARAVIARRFQIFPVAIETRIVTAGHRLERMQHRGIRIRCRQCNGGERHIRAMTNRAVVVIGFLIVKSQRPQPVMQLDAHRLKFIPLEAGNRVLMLVMRKLDCELPFLFRLHREFRDVWRAKRKPRIFTRRGAHMTDGANTRARSHHHLARKELPTVASHTGVMIGKVCDIGEVSLRIRCSWNFVTSIARQAFVFV